jgi:hypothetical protein
MTWVIVGAVVAVVVVFAVVKAVLDDRVSQARIERVLDEGRRTIAYFVMANSILYEPGEDDSYALVVFTFDESIDDLDAELERWAAETGRFRRRDARNSTEARIAEIIADQGVFDGHLRLPKSITGSIKGYMTCVKVIRELLPRGKITVPYVFIRVLMTDDGGTVMVKYPRK